MIIILMIINLIILFIKIIEKEINLCKFHLSYIQ